jgi:hypothetical protein
VPLAVALAAATRLLYAASKASVALPSFTYAGCVGKNSSVAISSASIALSPSASADQ